MSLTTSTSVGAANATIELSVLVKADYETMLLDRAVASFVHARFGTSATIAQGKGGRKEWRKFNALTAATTPLNEDETPTPLSITVSDVTATPVEYGAWVQYTRLLEYRSIDPFVLEVSQVLGEQCGDTVDQVARDALEADLTVLQIAGGGTAIGDVSSTDYLTFTELVKGVATLQTANARTFEDGAYRLIIHPHVAADLALDADVQELWDNRARLGEDNPYEKGYVGTIWGIKVYQSSNAKITTQSAAPDVYTCTLIGRQAYGVVGLAESEAMIPDPQEGYSNNTGGEMQSPVELIVREKGWNDALRRFGALGWLTTFDLEVLNTAFALRIYCASRMGSAT